jgi:superfamily II DNA helicase RecQ
MQIKIFHIRLSKEHFQADQDTINNFLSSVTVKKTATELVTGPPHNFWSILVFYDDPKIEKPTDKLNVTEDTELTDDEKQIFETLKHWRQDKGNELRIPNFMVCHNTELMTIAKVKPRTLDELSKIKGFGEQKIAKFGDEIIAVLNSIS